MTSLRGRKRTWDTPGMKGKKHSEKTKRKMSVSLSGKNNPNFGRPLSEETKQKIREKKYGNLYGNWKGGVGSNIHDWVRMEKGNAKNYICEQCKSKKAFDWSNIDHKYKKDLKDYRALCRSCHNLWDIRVLKTKQKTN